MHDDLQWKAAKRLSKLQKVLIGYDDHDVDVEIGENSSTGTDTTTRPIPRGLFVHGDVGTGKSLLLDVFYDAVPLVKKRRVHFHAFLQDVHDRIHRLKRTDLRTRGRDFHVDTSVARNPIYRVARALSDEVKVLCFDEFQVTDVADALILSQLFSVLFQRGTVVVATSNRPPADLYEGGLNRSYFLPFVDLLCQYCAVHSMDSAVDYRRVLAARHNGTHDAFFFVRRRTRPPPLTTVTDQDPCEDCDALFRQLGGQNKSTAQSRTASSSDSVLNIGYGRTLRIKQHSFLGDTVCRFRFGELCQVDFGAADYRAIAHRFRILIIEDIPKLTLKEHDQARRFITLIDEVYEAKVCLVCSAVALPDELFVDRHRASATSDGNAADGMETKVGEMFGIDVAQGNGKTIGELASVRELSFAFRRASSRLVEMTSKSWWNKHCADL